MKIVSPHDKDLMEWFVPWLKEHNETDLIFYESVKSQIIFVRDQIAPLIEERIHDDLRPKVEVPLRRGGTHMVKRTAYIVGTHTSKSCELPVYCFERPDLGLQLIMRGDFHDWKLSVLSETRIEVPQLKYMAYTEPPREPEYIGNCLDPCYFEGFRKEWCFGYYEEDHRRFSVELCGEDSLQITIFLIMCSLDALKTRRQPTEEEVRNARDEYKRIGEEYWDKEREKDDNGFATALNRVYKVKG